MFHSASKLLIFYDYYQQNALFSHILIMLEFILEQLLQIK